MARPEGLKYLESHEWCRIDGEFAYIGITDYAVEQLGEPVHLDVRKLDDDIMHGEIFGEIESTKAVSDLYAPLTGRIVERNEELISDPSKIGEDPFGNGWILKIQIEKAAEADALLDDAAYQKVIDADDH